MTEALVNKENKKFYGSIAFAPVAFKKSFRVH
jgi:hypothetical protein